MNVYSIKVNQQYEENSFHHFGMNKQRTWKILPNYIAAPNDNPMVSYYQMLSSRAYNVLRRVLVLPCGHTHLYKQG